jgi:hypothetical protein
MDYQFHGGIMRHLRVKKLLLATLLSSLSLAAFADKPIKLIPNGQNSTAVPADKIINLVKKNVDLSSASIASATVQVIYNKQNKPDHLLVYLLSAKSYSFTVTKINLNQDYRVTSIQSSYHLDKADLAQQIHIAAKDIQCPDETIEIVSATPVDDYPTAFAGVKNVYEEAVAYGYKATMLLGANATVENYVNYLSCPNLKGFLNIGHGSEGGIMLDDGVLTSDEISQDLKDKLRKEVFVLFNSCEVFNNPLKSSLTEDAVAKKYSGGITALLIGPSELASQCIWNSAYQMQKISPAVKYCNMHFDSRDKFGIGGHGTNFLDKPNGNVIQ